MNLLKSITVEPMGLLFMFAIFGEYTVVQDLLFVKFCLSSLNKTHFNECLFDKTNQTKELSLIESQTSEQLVNYSAILYFTSIISSFIAGSYGDSYGRIVPLLVPPICSVCVQILLIISSIALNSNAFIPLIMICGLISGTSGGSSSFLANCFGFIADITNQKQRTKRLVVFEANIFCGAFFGYLSSGLILKSFINYKYFICFSLYLIIHSLILIYVLMRLRKVVPNQTLRPVSNGFGFRQLYHMFSDVFKTVFKRRESNIRKIILLLILVFVFVSLGSVVQTSLLFLFVRNNPLVWDTSMYAYYSGLKFGVTGLALCLLPLMQNYLCPNISDTSIAIIGTLSRSTGLVLIGFATNTYVMFASIALFVFSEYPLPAIRSILSKLVTIDERGKVFASLSSLHNITLFCGGIIFPIVYKYQIQNNSYSGLCFQTIAFIQIVAILIFLYIGCELKSTQFTQLDNSSDVLVEDNVENEE